MRRTDVGNRIDIWNLDIRLCPLCHAEEYQITHIADQSSTYDDGGADSDSKYSTSRHLLILMPVDRSSMVFTRRRHAHYPTRESSNNNKVLPWQQFINLLPVHRPLSSNLAPSHTFRSTGGTNNNKLIRHVITAALLALKTSCLAA